MKKYIFLFLIIAGLILPTVSFAGLPDFNGPYVICGRSGTGEGSAPCTLCDIFKMVQKIIDLIIGAIIIIGPILIAVGGLMILFAGTDPGLLDKGKSVIKSVIIGLIIALLAWTAINMIFNGLTKSYGTEGTMPWNKIECTGGGINKDVGGDDTLKSGPICCCDILIKSDGQQQNHCNPKAYSDPSTCNANSGCESYCRAYANDDNNRYWGSCCVDKELNNNESCGKLPANYCCCNATDGTYSCQPDPYAGANECNAVSGCKAYCQAFVQEKYLSNCCVATKGKCSETGGGNCKGATCSSVNFCGKVSPSNNCAISYVSKWNTQISQATYGKSICGGIDTIKFVKAIMANESSGQLPATSPAGAAGLMQLLPSTANGLKSGCGVNDNITVDWLNNPANAEKQICIAIEFIKSLVGQCGCDIRNLAARYNGGAGPNQKGPCDKSANCGIEAKADGGDCIACAGDPYTLAWQCPWSDNKHTQCDPAFQETRNYVPKVNYCYDKF